MLKSVKLLGVVLNNVKNSNIKTITAAYLEDYGEYKIEKLYEAPLRIRPCTLPDVHIACGTGLSDHVEVDLGFGYLDNAKVTSMKLENPPKEMTLEEVEKKLGYKIKLVSNK